MQRIETALQLTEPSPSPSSDTPSELDRAGIIGESAALREVLDVVKRVARTDASVLITGESGTGKELIAEAIHRNSPRRRGPFVKVNLGGISQSLFESEMFGHKKGAFTDASADRVGRFEMADRGTIFLDEIGDLDLSCQVKLLRVLQEQTFEVLGDSRPRKVDIRVVSATNVDLPACVRQHTFREDLLYRINLITLHLPALRERPEDIPLLVNHFIAQQCRQNQLPSVRVSAEAMEYLRGLPYPGNIRELKNLVERTLLVSDGPVLQVDDFRRAATPPAEGNAVRTLEGMTLEDMERHVVQQALKRHEGNLSKVAKELGISRAALYRKLEKFNS
jgi:two-component system NtrC family response regulator